MKKQSVPYKRVLFVCTNKRDDGRPACGQRGSEAICERLKEEVKTRGLKGKVRVMKSGCHDVCELGPSVMVFPEQTLLTGVTDSDVEGILDEYCNPEP